MLIFSIQSLLYPEDAHSHLPLKSIQKFKLELEVELIAILQCGNSKGISDAKRDNIRAKREAKKAAERAKAAADAAGRASDSDSYSDSDSDSDSAPEACNNEFKSTSHYGERYVREGRETMHERDELYGTGESMELDDNLDIGTSFSLPDRTRAQPQRMSTSSLTQTQA